MRDGVVKPHEQPMLGDRSLAWFTDLDVPHREALGLTSLILSCDRTEHRFKVTQAVDVRWWPRFARELGPREREPLESAAGAMPGHWYVADVSVPVVAA